MRRKVSRNSNRERELRIAILNMSFGDLMKVSEAFADMTAPDNGVRPRPKKAEDFASLLYDWADAKEE